MIVQQKGFPGRPATEIASPTAFRPHPSRFGMRRLCIQG